MRRRSLLGGSVKDTSFIMTFKTDNAGVSASNALLLPIQGSNMFIDWGDGNTEMVSQISAPNNTLGGNNVEHTYAVAGTYVVRIKNINRLFFNNGGDRLKLVEINQFGNAFFTNITFMFFGCENLTQLPDDVDFFNQVTEAFGTFRNCGLMSLPNSMTMESLINGEQTFWENPLTSLPNGMLLNNLVIGTNMFRLSNLNSLPAGMELPLLTNGPSMFFGNNLIFLPAGMELPLLSIGDTMFRENNLSSLPTGMDLPLLINGNNMFRSNQLTTLPVGMKLQSVTNGSLMFLGNTINTTRYSQLLVDLEAENPNNNVPFHGGNSKYNATGQIARDILTGATRNWTITDAGLE